MFGTLTKFQPQSALFPFRPLPPPSRSKHIVYLGDFVYFSNFDPCWFHYFSTIGFSPIKTLCFSVIIIDSCLFTTLLTVAKVINLYLCSSENKIYSGAYGIKIKPELINLVTCFSKTEVRLSSTVLKQNWADEKPL